MAGGALAVLGAGQAAAQGGAAFRKLRHVGAGGQVMPYRLRAPKDSGRLPVVLWLHGAGGRGVDNEKQISGGNTLGATSWAAPCIVLAPQCPENEVWAPLNDRPEPTRHLRQALDILTSVMRTTAGDPARVYVVGQSMGGFGAWALAAHHPELFAAVVPLCGGGDARLAGRLAHTPIWAFHGAKDDSVPVQRSRDMVAAVRAAGGQPRYTEYPQVDHLVWERAFREPDLAPWLFGQRLAP